MLAGDVYEASAEVLSRYICQAPIPNRDVAECSGKESDATPSSRCMRRLRLPTSKTLSHRFFPSNDHIKTRFG